MSGTYVISRSIETDQYGVWAVDITSPTLLSPLPIDEGAVLDRSVALTAVGGYLLASTPLDHELQQFGFRLFAFDPTSSDPLNPAPVQEGFWDKEKFWNYYTYRNCPGDGEVTALQLIGMTGYVLSFLPTTGRGTFGLWNFDAASDNPGGSQDPLVAPMGDPGAFPDIGAGHTLLPVGNYVIDWVPASGDYRLYSFDPQLANPLGQPTICSGVVPADDGHDRLVVIAEHVLAWSSTTRAFTLYRFQPDQPFTEVVQRGTLPGQFDATTVLSSVQTLVPASDADVDSPGTMSYMRRRIKHVVYYVLESRSFDNVVGWLYENGTDDVNWVHAEAPFRGADESHTNRCGDEEFHQHKIRRGEISVDWNLHEPIEDPFHDTPDSIRQQWSGGYASYWAGEPADMQGFVANNGSSAVMATYTPEQLPVLNGLARNFALSDDWFCSEASGTTANRATLASGSAFNITASYESGPAYTYFPVTSHRQSMWKVLSNNGITDWKIYYSVEWGTPPFPYTYHLYLRGQVPSIDNSWQGHIQPIRSFLEAAQKGELPAFSFLEPVWFDPSGVFTSYHPTGDVIPGEVGLNDIYNAIKDGPGWEETVLVITFSKGGGMYDHVPSPRLRKAWPHDGVDGYGFDVAGTRVPAIVVSPWVRPSTVFRSDTDTPFDSTSLAATVLRWFGVPEARWGMGDRVPHAPTFETVLQEPRPRRDAPTLGRPFDTTYPPDAKVRTPPTTKARWNPTAGTGRWTRATNWRSGRVPTRKATFGQSTQTMIGFKKGSQSTIEEIVFEAGAPSYTFEFGEHQPDNPTLTISGKGVVNESDSTHSFVVAATSLQTSQAQLVFANRATAGDGNVSYSVGPRNPTSRSGGIISFNQNSGAGSASFTVTTGSKPTHGTTVGAEIRFNHDSSADAATFVAYGTTGHDGDTFGNVVFHNRACAAEAHFTNVGGTLPKGDGGNTQFFDTTSAAQATIVNQGGSVERANGGDVAFDGTATAANATIRNEAAPVSGGYGGVTSFNNNWPPMALSRGATAGQAVIDNLAAQTPHEGGGGHTKFTGMYGSGDGGRATITNHGTAVATRSNGGNTQFTMSGKARQFWRPSAGSATITNNPGACEGAQPGYTLFAVYDFVGPIPPGPTAGNATITSLGGTTTHAPGGITKFEQTSTAGNATLVATGGTNGGWSGRIEFYDSSEGGAAAIALRGGELDIGWYGRDRLTIGSLEIDDGTIQCRVGDDLTTLVVDGELNVVSKTAWFAFTAADSGFGHGIDYRLLESAGLSGLEAGRFAGNAVDGAEPTFRVDGDALLVTFAAPSS